MSILRKKNKYVFYFSLLREYRFSFRFFSNFMRENIVIFWGAVQKLSFYMYMC